MHDLAHWDWDNFLFKIHLKDSRANPWQKRQQDLPFHYSMRHIIITSKQEIRAEWLLPSQSLHNHTNWALPWATNNSAPSTDYIMEAVIPRDYLRTHSTKAESKAVWKHRKTINSCSRVRLPPYANLAGTALLNTDFHLCMSLKGGEEFTDNTCLCTKQATLPSVHY